MKVRIGLVLLGCIWACGGYAADLLPRCVEGCLDRGRNVTPFLIKYSPELPRVVLAWESSEAPDPGEGGEIVLYAGNPGASVTIPDRGALQFVERGNCGEHGMGDCWRAELVLEGDDLRAESLLTVVTSRKGDREEILHWASWRVLRSSDEATRENPAPGAQWELDLIPAYLHVESGHGKLPRSLDESKPAWWPLPREQGRYVNIDLDGEQTGVPGLSIHWTDPWPAEAQEDSWLEGVKESLSKFTGLGHRVHFTNDWSPAESRSVPLANGVEPIRLDHFYTIVTLVSVADADRFDGSVYSHETSAKTKASRAPQTWAAYSRRDFSADPHLLDLLGRAVRRDRRVPGLGPIEELQGDGGSPIYHVGLQASIKRWPGNEGEVAGFVAVDVVSARFGLGAIFSGSAEHRKPIQRTLCKFLQCDGSTNAIDLSNPPAGHRLASPFAAVETRNGTIPVWRGEVRVAERNMTAEELARNFPDVERFTLAAGLRSGALMRKTIFRQTKEMVPINAYAQYVVKLTVATFESSGSLVTNNEPNHVPPEQIGVAWQEMTPRGFLAWLKEHAWGLMTIVILALILAILIYVPGLASFISRFFKMLIPRSKSPPADAA